MKKYTSQNSLYSSFYYYSSTYSINGTSLPQVIISPRCPSPQFPVSTCCDVHGSDRIGFWTDRIKTIGYPRIRRFDPKFRTVYWIEFKQRICYWLAEVNYSSELFYLTINQCKEHLNSEILFYFMQIIVKISMGLWIVHSSIRKRRNKNWTWDNSNAIYVAQW